MSEDMTRRNFVGAAGAVALAGATARAALGQAAGDKAKGIRVIGVSCSPRKGKTTATAVSRCLDAIIELDPAIETELIELAGMNIGVFDPTVSGFNQGDFAKLVPKLSDPRVAGLIVGTPVYFSGMSSLCKAFLDNCMVFRKSKFALRNKVAGVLAVGGVRNGGQELAIESVKAALYCQEMIVVGDGRPTAHIGATLHNDGSDDITRDEFGLATVRNLGRRVAEVAMQMAS